MTPWDWIWAWTQDPKAWDWARPAISAFGGAIVGGGFTLIGLRQTAKTQRTQNQLAWEHEKETTRYESARADARKLFEGFTDLHREIQESPNPTAAHPTQAWLGDWKKLWNPTRSLMLDVGARLIPDDDVRAKIQELVQFLDLAQDLSDPDFEPSGAYLPVPLRYITLQISAEGIEVMGAYLRHAPYKTDRPEMWDDLRAAQTTYNNWLQHMMERHIADAEEWAERERQEYRRQQEEMELAREEMELAREEMEVEGEIMRREEKELERDEERDN